MRVQRELRNLKHLDHKQGGESKGNFLTKQDKMTPRKEICDNTVSGISFLLC